MILTRTLSRPCPSRSATRRAACVCAPATSRRAFTLIELLVVTAIIATVSSIALVRYSNSLARYRLTIAAERIAADMELTRTRARTASASRAIAFDVASSSYRISAETMNPKSSVQYAVDLTAEPYSIRIGSVSFSGSDTLTFDAYGNISGNGGVRLAAGSTTCQVLISTSGEITIVGP